MVHRSTSEIEGIRLSPRAHRHFSRKNPGGAPRDRSAGIRAAGATASHRCTSRRRGKVIARSGRDSACLYGREALAPRPFEGFGRLRMSAHRRQHLGATLAVALFPADVMDGLRSSAPIGGRPQGSPPLALTYAATAPRTPPSPLWGGVGGGGRGVEQGCAPRHDPPPQPSPTRGEGVAAAQHSVS